MLNWKKITIGVAMVAIIAIASTAVWLWLHPVEEVQVKPIKIGILEPLTGASAYAGRGGLYGFQIAVQHINEKGGVLGRPLVLIVEDTEGDPNKAISAAKKLITSDKVDFLAGLVLSGEAMAVADVVADYKTILMTTNPTTNELTRLVENNYERYKYLFRTQWNVTQWMWAWFSGFTDLFPDMKSVVFVTEDLMWAREATVILGKYFRDAGIEYMDILFTPGTMDFSAEIAKIEGFNPDVVLVDLLQSTSVSIIKQWYALKPPSVFVGASGMLSYPVVLKELGAADTDYLLTYNHLWRVPKTELTIRYFDDFVKISGDESFGTDSTSYDGLILLAKAIEIAGTTDADAVIKALEKNEFLGARGTYRFMRNHQAEYISGLILQWKNLKATVVWPPELATGEFQKPPWVP